jgi:signal transduction histidine kinase/ActR/RegA family two-component response regulator
MFLLRRGRSVIGRPASAIRRISPSVRINRRLVTQIVAGGLICVAAAPLLAWPLIASWFAVVLASSWLEEIFHQSSSLGGVPASRAARMLPPLFRSVATTLYALMAAVLIVRGQAAAREFAFAMMAVSMVYVLMRYYRWPWVFVLCISPHLAVLTWVGVRLTREALAQGQVLEALTPIATVALFAVLFWAARSKLAESRSALTAAMAEARGRARAADAANHAKSSFLACMSHELRTPLNGVIGMAQAMMADDLSGVQRERLKTIRRSGQTLLSVLDDLLDLSKIETDGPEPQLGEFDLPHLVRGVGMAFEALAQEKGLAFQLAIAPAAAGACLGDAARLRRTLSALLSNAVKFTDEGTVQVRVERMQDDIQFHVTDTGVGIAADELPHLFEVFYQADGSVTRRFGGTGVGLAVCHKLAQLMDGAITVASEPGVGSTFTLRVPLPRKEPVESAAPVVPAALTCAGVRVLAAEDNPVNRLVLQALLAQAGIAPTMVRDGREAVEAWRDGSWDLVIMDIQMPEMDGVSATLAIREQERIAGGRRTPIIALTANTMTHQLAEYAAAGMDSVIPKPVDAAQLFEAIEQSLNAGADQPHAAGIGR